MLSFDVIIFHGQQMISFLCYHFSLYIIVLSFMLSFDVIIYCYHFPPFIFFLKTWHTHTEKGFFLKSFLGTFCPHEKITNKIMSFHEFFEHLDF